MFSLVNIDHIVLNASDGIDSMLHFYCQVLGCTVEREVSDFGLTQLRAGNAIIDLLITSDTAANQKKSKNLEHFCLTIDQPIDNKLISYLTSQGISVSEIMDNYGAQGFGPSIYINDPLGNTIELKQVKG